MGVVRVGRDWTRVGVIVVLAWVLISAGCGVRVIVERGDVVAVPGTADTSELPDDIADLAPLDAARIVAGDPALALARTDARPNPSSPDPWERGIARLLPEPVDLAVDGAKLYAAMSMMDVTSVEWLATLYPSLVANRPGVPFDVRIAANRIRVAAAVERSRAWPQPRRPWSDGNRPPRAELVALRDRDPNLVHFDPLGNRGEGSWIELVGDLARADKVGVLVPGGSAFLTSDNFTRYEGRARSFVDATPGLAMMVWAAAPFPTGWIEEASSDWAEVAAVSLAAFTRDIRQQVGADVDITLAGHSYGGAMAGLSEMHPMAADRILHIASAGAGYGVWTPSAYQVPCRPRYVVMAPGDPISYVQNIPSIAGLGHGISTALLNGAIIMKTGRLPDDPTALDDVGRSLGSLGIAGQSIGGTHAHSEVFIPDSGAWKNMRAVFAGDDPIMDENQPDPLAGC